MSDRNSTDHGFYKVNAVLQSGLEDSGHLVGVGNGFGGFQLGLSEALEKTHATTGGYPKKKLRMPEALTKAKAMFKRAHSTGHKVIFIGNGGSSAIASHMAVDFTKNGGIRAVAFNDAPTLTCLANDFGLPAVFAKQVEYYASKKDVIVLISSSGKSTNIVNAATAGMNLGCDMVTLTGMLEDNPLRGLGDVNFWVPSGDYGLIEITHLSILHSIVSVRSANL